MNSTERAANWLASEIIDSTTKEAIGQLKLNPAELHDAFYTDLEFGTGGLRGVMGVGTNRMNKYTVGMATQGLANYLKLQFPNEAIKVAVAHDSRNQSDFFTEITASVFSANGIKVYLFPELRPTPELSFAIRTLGCQSGVVITASHNPKEYNGYKAYWSDGAQLIAPHDKGVIAEVRKITTFEQVKFEKNPALIEYLKDDIDEAYLDAIHALSRTQEVDKSCKIVYSPIHGTGITLVPRVLKKFGFTNVQVVEAQATPDGNFPTVVYPNPEEKEAMKMALQAASTWDADIVMATDPDADRVGIGVKNHRGEFQLLNGNQTGALLIYYLLKMDQKHGFKGNEFIAKTIVTSDLLSDIAAKFGVKSYETLTGFKYIAQLIREKEGVETYIGGGEESYGYMISDYVRDKDAIASCALLAEVCGWAKHNKKSLYDLLLDIYQEFGYYQELLHSLTKKGESGLQEISAMMERFRSNQPRRLGGVETVQMIDYQLGTKTDLRTNETVKIQFPTSNVLQFVTADGAKVSLRPSGTEPKIKFYFSVKTELHSKEAFDESSALLEKKLHSLLNDMTN
jgi:phosphoglucomutase